MEDIINVKQKGSETDQLEFEPLSNRCLFITIFFIIGIYALLVLLLMHVFHPIS